MEDVTMRLIDADALSEYVEKQYMGFIGNPTWDDINSAPTIKTKQIKYYDEDEKVWKVGEVIVDE